MPKKNNRFVIRGLSAKEMKIVSNLEFSEKYYFTREDIEAYVTHKREMINTIYALVKKGRVVRLNKNKYFLVPIKARLGKWTDEPFVIIDETLNGKDYYVGGWAAANYWRLTDQIPFRYDVYTTRRQGRYNLLGVEIIFHRTTKENMIKKSCEKEINKHKFKILNKKESKRWMSLRE